jgi:phosphinothricin acetyltransferase
MQTYLMHLDAVQVEPMRSGHARDVLAIYRAGIEEGNATFETQVPGWDEFSAARLPDHRYVAVTGPSAGPSAGPSFSANASPSAGPASQRTVLGWVCAAAVSSRCVYGGVVEHSVYVRPDARGLGIGHKLLDALIASTEAAGIWTIQAGIFPENTASIALHHTAGFRIVGTRERIGRQHGRWRDILLMERRSPAI